VNILTVAKDTNVAFFCLKSLQHGQLRVAGNTICILHFFSNTIVKHGKMLCFGDPFNTD
jgi:hypothetical protein